MSFELPKNQELGNNYIKFPNGFMIAWGNSDVAKGSSGRTIAFPVAFAEIPKVITTPIYTDGCNVNTSSIVRDVTVNNFWCYVYDLGLVYNSPRRFNWIAIGKA